MMLEVLKTSAKPDALIDELIGVTRELIRQTRELAHSLCPDYPRLSNSWQLPLISTTFRVRL